jgi:DNA mismatch repair protein MutL
MFRPRIEVLPEKVTNKIAAGEIVERPAAAIKELVENSLDAESKQIDVRFLRGGKLSMIVDDDGCGMRREDAVLSIKRHATSKLRDIGDLSTLLTFGFRGEALPSIASVSKFRLMTCHCDDSCGTEVIMNGGEIVEVRDCAKFSGTKVIVENLFHNVPARRKFLRSDETESAHIVHLIKCLALAESSVKFSLWQNGNKVFSSPDARGCGDRVNEIFRFGEKFIDFSHEDDSMAVSGTICDPTFGNVCRKNIVLFVNNRLVRSDALNFALCEELRPIFPAHRGILAYVFLKIDPAIVDVNVHPMKREVRFKNDAPVRNLIKKCMGSLFEAREVQSVAGTRAIRPSKGGYSSGVGAGETGKDAIGGATAKLRTARTIAAARQGSFNLYSTDGGGSCEWRFIGTAFGEIALFESKSGVIVFNIRLAASRVFYERMTSHGWNSGSQLLLMAVEFSLSDGEIHSLQKFSSVLSKHGFSIYSFGRRDYKMDAIPEWMSLKDAEVLVRDLLAGGENFGKNPQRVDLEEMFVRRMSLAVNLENFKSSEDIEKLRDMLLESKNPLICPFGNATYFELPLADIGHRFHEKIR